MNRRDCENLQSLLLRLTAEFSNPLIRSTDLFRGEARAVVAAIRELDKQGKLFVVRALSSSSGE